MKYLCNTCGILGTLIFIGGVCVLTVPMPHDLNQKLFLYSVPVGALLIGICLYVARLIERKKFNHHDKVRTIRKNRAA